MREQVRLMGAVRWFNDSKGFGFICSGGVDYFVHFKSIQGLRHKKLSDGQKVSFVEGKSSKGLTAEQVIILDN
jgi:CspA family cold shock protein